MGNERGVTKKDHYNNKTMQKMRRPLQNTFKLGQKETQNCYNSKFYVINKSKNMNKLKKYIYIYIFIVRNKCGVEQTVEIFFEQRDHHKLAQGKFKKYKSTSRNHW